MSPTTSTRKPYKVLDRTRTFKKGVMASSLEEFILSARRKLSYPPDKELVVVLEEDGTEVDEDDYFQTLESNTTLMLLFSDDKWSPFQTSGDVTDHGDSQNSKLIPILSRLSEDPGTITLLSEADMELLSEMDISSLNSPYLRYDQDFLQKLQSAAGKHLREKSQIRDTLALLKIYHKANNMNGDVVKTDVKRDYSGKRESARKRQKGGNDTVDN